MQVRDILHTNLIKHEGVKLKPYRDTAGVLTIGVGHNLENGITHKTVMQILDDDIDVATQDAKKIFPSLLTFSDNRQAALIELVFNMGLGTFSKFHTTIACIHAGNWKLGARNLLDSIWAKQVGHRAIDIANMIENG